MEQKRMTRMTTERKLVVYGTYNDEISARIIAEHLWLDQQRKATVMGVTEMHRMGHPLAPITTNRFAVIAEERG